MKSFVFIAFSLAFAASAMGASGPFTPDAPMIKIWPGVARGSEGKVTPEVWLDSDDAFHRVTNIHEPSLTIYQPAKEKAAGTAVIIAPGGGHRHLSIELEGDLVARKLNEMGVTAFVLRYRLARADNSTYKAEVEGLADMQQAIRVVRTRAAEWNVDAQRVGVMGFSAGGQLASLAGLKFDESTKPAFVALGYGAFLSSNAIPENAPPFFIFANSDDGIAAGSPDFYTALRKAKVNVELHLFRRGGHGVGATGKGPEFQTLGVAKWPELFGIWLADLGMLGRKS